MIDSSEATNALGWEVQVFAGGKTGWLRCSGVFSSRKDADTDLETRKRHAGHDYRVYLTLQSKK